MKSKVHTDYIGPDDGQTGLPSEGLEILARIIARSMKGTSASYQSNACQADDMKAELPVFSPPNVLP